MVVVAVAIGFVVGFVGTNLMEGEDEDDDEEELVSCGNGKIKEGYRGTDPVGGRFDSIRFEVRSCTTANRTMSTTASTPEPTTT